LTNLIEGDTWIKGLTKAGGEIFIEGSSEMFYVVETFRQFTVYGRVKCILAMV